jgi:hypothetical protein
VMNNEMMNQKIHQQMLMLLFLHAWKVHKTKGWNQKKILMLVEWEDSMHGRTQTAQRQSNDTIVNTRKIVDN